MNIFEINLYYVILIAFPYSLYLFYLAYSKDFTKEERSFFLDLAIFSSFYIILRFQINDKGYMGLIFLNIPILIAYITNHKISALFITLLLSMKYYQLFSWPLQLSFFECLVYYLCSYLFTRKKEYNASFIFTFIFLKLIIFTIMISYSNYYRISTLISDSASFIFVSILILFMFDKGKDIIKLHMSLKDLENDNQIKTSLFKITHEIKNPIAVCKGYLDMFDVNNIEHSRKYIPIMKEEIERTLLLLQDFLSMTRVKIDKDVLDINLLLEDVIDSYNLLLKSHNIQLNTNLIDDEIYIRGDYNRLSQVFLNIVKNSIEAIESNGIISIGCKLNNGNIIININDNGCGIRKEDMDQISIPFYTTKQNGTGLGVSLSYEIIKAHDGKINYDSVYGVGTNVKISLPILSII